MAGKNGYVQKMRGNAADYHVTTTCRYFAQQLPSAQPVPWNSTHWTHSIYLFLRKQSP